MCSPDVLAKRKAAPANLTSTTNWTDRFVSGSLYPEFKQGGARIKQKFQLPQIPLVRIILADCLC